MQKEAPHCFLAASKTDSQLQQAPVISCSVFATGQRRSKVHEDLHSYMNDKLARSIQKHFVAISQTTVLKRP